MSFPELLTMGRYAIERFVAGPDDVCISIRGPGDLEPAPRLSPNFAATLPLEFDDFPWTDVPVPEGGQQISDEQADAIVRFVAAHQHARRLVVQCVAGASRSVSIAMALSMCFTGQRWFPPDMPQVSRIAFLSGAEIAPNPNVYQAIVLAYYRAKEVTV